MGTIKETGLFKIFIDKLPKIERIEFLQNLAHDEDTNFDRYCHITNATDFVSFAFDWDESDSGFNYWEKISTKWRDYLSAFKNAGFNDLPDSKCKSIW